MEKALAKFQIKEMGNDEAKERMVRSLEKGNTTQVTMIKDGQEQKMHIEANPKFKSLDVYDQNLKKQFQKNEKEGKETGQEKSKEKKETVKADDDDDSPRQTKKKKRGVGV